MCHGLGSPSQLGVLSLPELLLSLLAIGLNALFNAKSWETEDLALFGEKEKLPLLG